MQHQLLSGVASHHQPTFLTLISHVSQFRQGARSSRALFLPHSGMLHYSQILWIIIEEKVKKQTDIDNTQKGIGHGHQPEGQVEVDTGR
jgi:hypothetical protein